MKPVIVKLFGKFGNGKRRLRFSRSMVKLKETVTAMIGMNHFLNNTIDALRFDSNVRTVYI